MPGAAAARAARARPLLQLASDLHLEKRPPDAWRDPRLVQPAARFLLLAGDVGDPAHASYGDFLAAQADRFEGVAVVLGNHEHYGRPLAATRALAAEACARHERLHLLSPGAVDFGGVRVLGATLWTHVPRWAQPRVAERMRDFAEIEWAPGEPLAPWHWNALHARDRAWLASQLHLEDDSRTTVVVTHCAPCLEGAMAPWRIKGAMPHAFGTELPPALRERPALWAFGHTHWNVCGGGLAANQLGAPGHGSEETYAGACVLPV